MVVWMKSAEFSLRHRLDHEWFIASSPDLDLTDTLTLPSDDSSAQ